MSVFGQFVKQLRSMGVNYELIHQFPKNKWQSILDDGGYRITSNACIGVRFPASDMVFMFSSGQPDWTANPEQGYGQEGSFLLYKDGDSVRYRQSQDCKLQGLKALAQDQGFVIQKDNPMKVKFVSVWDGGRKIVTDATYYPDERRVGDIEFSNENGGDLDILDGEFVQLGEDEDYLVPLAVCECCNEYFFKDHLRVGTPTEMWCLQCRTKTPNPK